MPATNQQILAETFRTPIVPALLPQDHHVSGTPTLGAPFISGIQTEILLVLASDPEREWSVRDLALELAYPRDPEKSRQVMHAALRKLAAHRLVRLEKAVELSGQPTVVTLMTSGHRRAHEEWNRIEPVLSKLCLWHSIHRPVVCA